MFRCPGAFWELRSVYYCSNSSNSGRPVAAIQNANKVSSRVQTICGSVMGGEAHWQEQIQNVYQLFVYLFAKNNKLTRSPCVCILLLCISMLSRRCECMGECL